MSPEVNSGAKPTVVPALAAAITVLAPQRPPPTYITR